MSEELLIAKLHGVKFYPLEFDCEVMTIEEFESHCKSGGIIATDGDGYYCIQHNGNWLESWELAMFSDFDHPTWATHVAWYNN